MYNKTNTVLWDNECLNKLLLFFRLARIDVLGLACAVNHEKCLTEAQTQFNEWILNRQPLSQDLRGLAYKYGISPRCSAFTRFKICCISGMRNSNESTWETLLEIYKTENDANEKLKLIYGLAYVNNVTLLSRYMR